MNPADFFQWGPSPILLSLGPLQIRWYGLLFASGFVAGFYMLQRMYRIEGKNPENVDIVLTYMVVGTLLGARLGHCFFYEPDYYLSNPIEIFKFWRGGLASHGAALGIFTVLYLYTRSHLDEPYVWLMSRIGVVVAFAGFCIRMGNFFNSEIVGVPTDAPWAIVFTRLDAIPRHPTQLYEAISYLFIFFFLHGVYNRSKGSILPSRLLGWFFILVFGARFVLEFTKQHQAAFAHELPLRMGQLLSIPLVLFGLYMLLRKENVTTK
jgi:prolipoprotein diacylglyceryl transferase